MSEHINMNKIDFSKPHVENDFFHYSRLINGVRYYESYEKSTHSLVYQGPLSYWNRRDPAGYQEKMNKKSANYSATKRAEELVRREKEDLEAGVLRKTTSV